MLLCYDFDVIWNDIKKTKSNSGADMIEAFLFFSDDRGELLPATDMIDVYEGSLPPAAKFQVIDLEPVASEPDMEG
jgi:hypothetical protein